MLPENGDGGRAPMSPLLPMTFNSSASHPQSRESQSPGHAVTCWGIKSPPDHCPGLSSSRNADGFCSKSQIRFYKCYKSKRSCTDTNSVQEPETPERGMAEPALLRQQHGRPEPRRMALPTVHVSTDAARRSHSRAESQHRPTRRERTFQGHPGHP